VLHQIAAGTLGPVFRAYEPQLDKLVAVKMFRLSLAPERVHRFVDELQALVDADLSHPAVATPIAAGIAGGDAYLAQDFVAADSLDLILRAHGAAPLADAIRIATHLAAALDFAAVMQVHHGALHPRDVLVTADDTRLSSLGIAASLERVGVTPPVRPPYTAPERVAGRPWDRRADVFSLAAITVELVWGRRPGATGDRIAESLTELPGADLERLRAVFARALAEAPPDRYETALAFVEALRDACPHLDAGEERRPDAVARPAEVPVVPIHDRPRPAADVDPDPELLFPMEEHEPIAAEPAASAEPARSVPDLPLVVGARAEERDVVPDLRPPSTPLVPLPPGRPGVPPRTAAFPVPRSAQPTRSALWQLALALVVGIALGAAGAIAMFSGGHWPALEGRGEQGGATMPAAAATTGPDAAGRSALANPGVADRGAPAGAAPAVSSVPAADRQAASRPAASGRLIIRSAPPGARAFVDDRPVGVTPVTLGDLAPGTYTVRLATSGYVEARRRVVVGGRPQTLTINLVRASGGGDVRPRANAEARPRATDEIRQRANGRYVAPLQIDTRPTGAQVFLDGRLIGTAPMVVEEVGVGEHAVRLELAGYVPWTSSVRVVAGQRTRVAASLEPRN
jgi:hypothetical protein